MVVNNLCIYTKQLHDDSEIKSGDHIMLAALGGIKKLPKSYVSHDANNYLSKLEKHFTRDSIISLIRQFEGPGKRGKLNPKNASKSKVAVMISDTESDDDKKYKLGYLELGKPYVINHFIFNLDSINKTNISTLLNPTQLKDYDDPQEILFLFVDKAKTMKEYILIVDSVLPHDIALFGELDNKWFLAVTNKSQEVLALKYIKLIQESNSTTVKTSQKNSNQVRTHQTVSFDINVTFRAIAKMVFNLLAFEKGQDFILDSRFDSLRNWIYTGEGENKFVNLIESNNVMKQRFGPLYPERAHYIFISQIDNKLIGSIGFYGATFSFSVILTDLAPYEILFTEPIGLICDWKNRTEYSLKEYVLMITGILDNSN